MTAPTLRPYQLDGLARVRAVREAGHRRILVVAPTGTGKTVMFSSLIVSARGMGTRVLVMAHRRELIAQATSKIIASGVNPRDVGVVMADGRIQLDGQRVDMRRPAAGVQVGSVDTLRNRRPPPVAELVIVDEAHRTLSPTYMRLLEDYYPQATILGWTATPFRADSRGMGEAYDKLVVICTPSEAIGMGAIIEPRVFSVPEDQLPDLSNVKMKGGDYDQTALAEAVDKDQLVGDIVEHWRRSAEGRITVAFAASVEHSKHLAARFCAAGIRAEHLDGMTDDETRAAILRRLDSGQTQVVTNFGVLAEGWDQPSCKCLILARPTKSTGLFLQQAGRILRPWRGVVPIILDHAGCALEHGLPQFDREYSLDIPKKKKRNAGPACKTCLQCFAIVPAGLTRCNAVGVDGIECGYVFAAQPGESLEEGEGELVEVDGERWAAMLIHWRVLIIEAEQENHPHGWEKRAFRKRWGRSPPLAFPKRKVEWSQAEKLNEYRRLKELEERRGFRLGWAVQLYQERFNEPPPKLPNVVPVAERVRPEAVEVVPWTL